MGFDVNTISNSNRNCYSLSFWGGFGDEKFGDEKIVFIFMMQLSMKFSFLIT